MLVAVFSFRSKRAIFSLATQPNCSCSRDVLGMSASVYGRKRKSPAWGWGHEAGLLSNGKSHVRALAAQATLRLPIWFPGNGIQYSDPRYLHPAVRAPGPNLAKELIPPSSNQPGTRRRPHVWHSPASRSLELNARRPFRGWDTARCRKRDEYGWPLPQDAFNSYITAAKRDKSLHWQKPKPVPSYFRDKMELIRLNGSNANGIGLSAHIRA
jgi:hypothetical protein